MKLNKYLPFAVIYFFFNSVGLPFGLTFTALLGPFFYIWVLLVRKKEILLPFILVMLPFILVHLFVVGVDLKSYTLSFINLTFIYCFCQAVYIFLKNSNSTVLVFRRILVLNFIFCLVAIPVYFTPWANWLWLEQYITANMTEPVRRLKLLTYEPSYYALLFAPFFIFFLLQYFFRQNTIRGQWLLPMIFLPLVLSFSIGVISALLIAGLLTWVIHFRKLTRKRRILNMLVNTAVVAVGLITILVVFFRDNPFFYRLVSIFSGEDTSGRGRTIDAFILAQKLLKERNEYWGVGLGQIKLMGQDIIRNYYLYYRDYNVAIPNAAAETLAIFGWVGFILRLLVEMALFFYTKVWTNYFRLLLFFFMFIYQFTGSFITNVAEYVIWAMVFTSAFRQFDVYFKAE
jgi:hypothetical protein